jgi:hypothetical protein
VELNCDRACDQRHYRLFLLGSHSDHQKGRLDRRYRQRGCDFSSSGNLAKFTAILRASSRASALSGNALQNFSAELFHERAGRGQIGKAPPKIDLAFYNNPPSVPGLNFSRPVKVHYPVP